MQDRPTSITRGSITRISVSASGRGYLVRCDTERPMKVVMGAWGLECECGLPACRHIESVTACGFVEGADEQVRAA